MKNIFNFFFPKNKASSIEPKTEVEIKAKSESIPIRQSNYSETNIPEAIKDKKEDLTYDIDKVRKEVEKIEKEQGSQAIIGYLRELFDNNHLSFNHLISFFKVLVRNMKKGKAFTPDEIFLYVNNQIEKYSEKDDVAFFCNIADILGRIKKDYAINFLEGKLNPPESDAIKDISYLSPMIELSSYYKDKEKASELKERAFALFSKEAKQLDFKSLISSLSSLVYSLRDKEEYSDQNKITFINENLRDYDQNTDFKSIKRIADLFGLVGSTHQIEYLTRMFNSTDDKFSLLLELSDTHFKNGDPENAFKSLAKASMFLPDFNSTDYLSDLIKIKDRSANVIEHDKNPNYEAYLIFSLESYALDNARDLSMYPMTRIFYEHKDNKFDYDPNNIGDFMEVSLKKLGIYDLREEMFGEYNKFIFDELPLIYGIPSGTNEELSRRMALGPKHWLPYYHDICRIPRESLDLIVYKIHDFIIHLLKKYHDIGMSGLNMHQETN